MDRSVATFFVLFAGVALGALSFTQDALQSEEATDFLAAADITPSSRLDVVWVNDDTDQVRYLKNQGGGSFAATPVTIANLTLGSCTRVITGDFSQNGRGDVVVLADCGSGIVLYENLGNSNWGAGETLYGGHVDKRAICSADLSNSGYPDVAFADCATNSIGIMYNQGGMLDQFESPFWLPTTDNGLCPKSIFAVDVNNDNLTDIIAGKQDALVWFENNGKGIAFQSHVIATSEEEIWESVVAADLNGDGFTDIIVGTNSRVAYYPNNRNGTFGSAVTLQYTNGPVYSVSTGHFSDDIHPDIVATASGDDEVFVIVNKGNWDFTPDQGFAAQPLRSSSAVLFGHVADIIYYRSSGLPGLYWAKNDFQCPASTFYQSEYNNVTAKFVLLKNHTGLGVTSSLGSVELDEIMISIAIPNVFYNFTIEFENGRPITELHHPVGGGLNWTVHHPPCKDVAVLKVAWNEFRRPKYGLVRSEGASTVDYLATIRGNGTEVVTFGGGGGPALVRPRHVSNLLNLQFSFQTKVNASSPENTTVSCTIDHSFAVLRAVTVYFDPDNSPYVLIIMDLAVTTTDPYVLEEVIVGANSEKANVNFVNYTTNPADCTFPGYCLQSYRLTYNVTEFMCSVDADYNLIASLACQPEADNCTLPTVNAATFRWSAVTSNMCSVKVVDTGYEGRLDLFKGSYSTPVNSYKLGDRILVKSVVWRTKGGLPVHHLEFAELHVKLGTYVYDLFPTPDPRTLFTSTNCNATATVNDCRFEITLNPFYFNSDPNSVLDLIITATFWVKTVVNTSLLEQPEPEAHVVTMRLQQAGDQFAMTADGLVFSPPAQVGSPEYDPTFEEEDGGMDPTILIVLIVACVALFVCFITAVGCYKYRSRRNKTTISHHAIPSVTGGPALT